MQIIVERSTWTDWQEHFFEGHLADMADRVEGDGEHVFVLTAEDRAQFPALRDAREVRLLPVEVDGSWQAAKFVAV